MRLARALKSTIFLLIFQYGNICLDILKEKWSALYEVRTILLSIQTLLGEIIA